MQNRNNNGGGTGLFTFLVGIAAGAAAGYYLSTEEGRRMRQRVTERTSTLAQDAQNYAREATSKVTTNIQTAAEQGRGYIDNLTTDARAKFDQVTQSARDQVDRTQSAFQDGVDRGKAKLDQQKAEIDNLVHDTKKNGEGRA